MTVMELIQRLTKFELGETVFIEVRKDRGLAAFIDDIRTVTIGQDDGIILSAKTAEERE